MDLIYTNADKVDVGVLSAYAFDLSFGADENDFEVTLGENEPALDFGALIYMEGTEYGGMVDGRKTSTNSKTITYNGRTWHGILNSKIIEPDSGEDHLVVSGDANEVLATLIDRLGLSGLFTAASALSGVNISGYQFKRYCKGYDGIIAMLKANGAKLNIVCKNRAVHLSAKPIANYTDAPVDGESATLTVEQNSQKVNHLICLGKGELAEREVIHLYADDSGYIGDVQHYTGLDEIVDTYENSNSDDLRNDGIKRLTDMRKIDKADFDIPETVSLTYDIGDIVGATDMKSGIRISETVIQKIIRITNGIVRIQYKTGGKTETAVSSGSTGGGSDFSNDGSGDVNCANLNVTGLATFSGQISANGGIAGVTNYPAAGVEELTGGTWVNSSGVRAPVYRQVLTYTVSTVDSTLDGPTIADFGELVAMTGRFYRTSDPMYHQLNFYRTSSDYNYAYMSTAGVLRVRSSDKAVVTAIVEYTKATD